MAAKEPVASVQSLTRGLAVIRSFSGEHPRRTLTQVAEDTGLARATARRFLHTLVGEGYARTDGTWFWLSPKILELGFAYLSSLGLPDIAQPHLEALSQDLNESCSLSVLDGVEVVYVARTAVSRIMSTNITIGTRFPAYATSMGRVLLAHVSPEALDTYFERAALEPLTPHTLVDERKLRSLLFDVRLDGLCIVDQELETGLRSIAAPVLDPEGVALGAINVSTHASRYTFEEIEQTIGPKLQTTAEHIAADYARIQP